MSNILNFHYHIFDEICIFVILRTLMRVFPRAKVVLTVRDPVKWYESVKATIFKIHQGLDGTVGLFLKLIGKSRLRDVVKRTSDQGPPVNKLGT